MANIEDFTRYSKISETFAYFNDGFTLKFSIKLKRKNKEGDEMPYHREYTYKNEDGTIGHSINLTIMSAGWNFGKSSDLKNTVFISLGNLVVVRYHLKNILEDWYLGKNMIYTINKDGRLVIKGKWTPVQIAFDDYNFIEFTPIIITYENNVSTQGCRVAVNSRNNYIDMSVNEFLTLYSALFMDTGALISGLLNYVKSPPYKINESRIDSSFEYKDEDKPNSNYFTGKNQPKKQ